MVHHGAEVNHGTWTMVEPDFVHGAQRTIERFCVTMERRKSGHNFKTNNNNPQHPTTIDLRFLRLATVSLQLSPFTTWNSTK